MTDYLLKNLPAIVLIVVYFVRLEVKIAKIQQDICWIKKNINKCPQD